MIDKEKEEEIELEIVDDTPEEDAPFVEDSNDEDDLGNYGKKVQSRIKKLKFDYHDQRRAKESAERMKEEAIQFANSQKQENERLKKLLQDGNNVLQDVSKKKVASDLIAIEKEYQDAYDQGDSAKMLEAQKKLAASTYEERKLNELSVQKQQPVEQAVQQPVQQNTASQQPQVDPKAAKWLENNKWFQREGDEEMTAFAYGLHEKLIRSENIDPRSDEYYERIDGRLREVFPDFFETDESLQEEPVKTAKKAASVVASTKRGNSKAPRNIKLTKTQVQLAKRLGITNEQYANQMIKEQANAQRA